MLERVSELASPVRGVLQNQPPPQACPLRSGDRRSQRYDWDQCHAQLYFRYATTKVHGMLM